MSHGDDAQVYSIQLLTASAVVNSEAERGYGPNDVLLCSAGSHVHSWDLNRVGAQESAASSAACLSSWTYPALPSGHVYGGPRNEAEENFIFDLAISSACSPARFLAAAL